VFLTGITRRDHCGDDVVGKVISLPVDHVAEMPGQAARRPQVFRGLLGCEEGVDELEALPRPVAKFVDVVDPGNAEHVARQVIRQRKADLVDHAQFAAARLVRQRIVDDLLRAIAKALHRAVAERRHDEPSGPGVAGAVGGKGIAGEMNVRTGPLVVSPRDRRQPGIDVVVAQQEPLAGSGIDEDGALFAQPAEVGVRVGEVVRRPRCKRRGTGGRCRTGRGHLASRGVDCRLLRDRARSPREDAFSRRPCDRFVRNYLSIHALSRKTPERWV
jgi:hypothetical protein